MVNLSIVVSALGTEKQLEDTLVSVLTHRPDSCEVIVVYRGRYDDPYQIRGEVKIIELSQTASHVALANAGIRASCGSIINLMQVGTEVSESWAEAAMDRFRECPKLASCAPLVLQKENPKIAVSAGLVYRTRGLRKVIGRGQRARRVATRSCIGPTMSAGFYLGSLIRKLGGFDTSVGDYLADVDLALRLSRLGCRSVHEPDSVMTQDGHSTRSASSFDVGVHEEKLFWTYARDVGWIPSLSSHGLVLASDLRRFLVGPALVQCWLGRAKGAIESLVRPNSRAREMPRELAELLDTDDLCLFDDNQSAAA